MHEFILRTPVRHLVCALPDVLCVSNLFMDPTKVLSFYMRKTRSLNVC